MIGPKCIDDSGSLFKIEDLLDLPDDEVESALCPAPNCNATFNSSSLWPSQSCSLQPPNSAVFSCNSASDLCPEIGVPIEDIVQLEWLANFCEDSFSGGSLTNNNKNVLQSPGPVVPRKPRSKRPRQATFNPRSAIHLIFPASSVAEAEAEALKHQPLLPLIKIPKQASGEQKKKKKINLTLPQAQAEGNESSDTTQGAMKQVRKCWHCKITKSPQWRVGPMGLRTLCNACGIRYQVGGLFPEYRPAGSPTFVPALHSNSYEKVLQKRNKGGELVHFGETTTTMTETPELIPNSSHIIALDYM